jgi:type VI secretion system protein ImpA
MDKQIMSKFKELLNPISSEHVCGEDISFSREIDAISEARRFDDASLDQGEWVTDIKAANWTLVIELCTSLLKSKSKDLRLAVWLTEANAKVYQFAGLAEGYQLIADLFDNFWEGMYPLPDEADQEQRIGNLHWVLHRSIQLVKEMLITEGQSTTYSIIDYETAAAANVKKNAPEDDRSEEGLKLNDFDIARRKSSKEFYKKIFTDIKSCKTALDHLEHSVNARLGNEGPGFSATKDAVESALQLIVRFAQELGINLDKADHIEQATLGTQNDFDTFAGHTNNAGFSGSIQTRSQALAQLRAIAAYFRRTEPHSPVAYLAEKAANWGEMPLHGWLSNVIKDPTALSHVEELLGLESNKDQQ